MTTKLWGQCKDLEKAEALTKSTYRVLETVLDLYWRHLAEIQTISASKADDDGGTLKREKSN